MQALKVQWLCMIGWVLLCVQEVQWLRMQLAEQQREIASLHKHRERLENLLQRVEKKAPPTHPVGCDLLHASLSHSLPIG